MNIIKTNKCVFLYTKMEKISRFSTNGECERAKSHFLTNVTKIPESSNIFICSNIDWLKENFQLIIDLCYQIYLYEIEELELSQTLIFSDVKFKLFSYGRVNLKLSDNTKIILR